jgi:hypothetical protein
LCLALVEQRGVKKLALDNMPYLSIMYANGPGIANRTNLTDVDTRELYVLNERMLESLL